MIWSIGIEIKLMMYLKQQQEFIIEQFKFIHFKMLMVDEVGCQLIFILDKMPLKWQEDLLAKDNPKRNEYIQALKDADSGDFEDLIEMHRKTYQ